MAEQVVTFGAGCFWHVQAAFDKIDGVVETTVGYMGGDFAEPTYEEVHTGKTGHAEVCQVIYDTEKVSFGKLLDVFWSIHDPTQVDRQGPNVGPQYRSVVFFHSKEQREKALASREREAERREEEIATEILPAKTFWKAENCHQKYYKKGPLSLL